MTPADDYLSPGAFWFLLLAFVVGCVVLAIVHAEHRRADRRWARRQLDLANQPAPARVDMHCVIYGHAYRSHQTVWLCGVCGDRVPRDTLEETA
jgi:hypothetical protein